MSGSLVLCLPCLRSCLPTCLPVCQLVLQPGMLCPAPWSCLCLVSGLVSQLVSQTASLLAPWSCLCLVSGLVSQLVSQSATFFFTLGGVSRSLVFSLGRCVRLPGLVFLLSSVLSSIWPSMLCPPPWSCFGLSPVLSPSLFPKQFSVGVLNAVSASLVLCFSCLRSCLPSCLPAVLECGVCGLGLSQEFYVRFVQLFGVYGGVIFGRNCFILLMEEILHHLACTKRCKKSGRLQYQLFTL